MGAFGKLLIKHWGGNLDSYNNNSYVKEKTRIDKCNHCQQITKQIYDQSLSGKYEWLCLNCSTYSHVSPCPCGNCKTHPYKQTGLIEKDITI